MARRYPFVALGIAALALSAAEGSRMVRSDGQAGLPGEGGVMVAAAVFALIGAAGLAHRRATNAAVATLLEALVMATTIGVCAWFVVLGPASARAGGDAGAMLLYLIAAGILLAAGGATSQIGHRSAGPASAQLLAAALALTAAAPLTRLLEVTTSTVGPSPVAAALIGLGLGLGIAAGFRTWTANAPPAASARQNRLGATRLATPILSVLVVPVVTGWKVVAGDPVPAVSALVGSALTSVAVVAYLLALLREWARVEHRTLHDELTGLPNHTHLDLRITEAIAQQRKDADAPALLFCDLDRFKGVNDSLGHAAGDQLLRAVARRLVDATPDEALSARLRGDEFAVLLPASGPGPADPLAAAQRILDAFAQPFTLGRRQVFMTASIGVARIPEDGDTPAELLRSADTAMYSAKAAGRNSARLHHANMTTAAVDRFEIENSLHGAADRGQLRVVYQPRADLRTGAVIGAEALVRWDHPTLGPVGPDVFIPIAEETGLIVEVGEWVLRDVCRQLRCWAGAGSPRLRISVNLSPRQFHLQRVPDMVAQVLRDTGAEPTWLELELTESLAMEDPERVTEELRELAAMGVACVVDDFGTGYSGLSYLSRFPLAAVKIDKSFVRDIGADGGQDPMVVAVLAMAARLGLRVIAEGVETADQLSFLAINGCDEMQGNLFSPPVSVAQFENLVMLERVASGPGRLGSLGPKRLRDLVHRSVSELAPAAVTPELSSTAR